MNLEQPKINVKKLQKAANDAANKAYLAEIEDYYTSYNSPFKKAIKEQLEKTQHVGKWKDLINYETLGVYNVSNKISDYILMALMIFLSVFSFIVFKSFQKEFETTYRLLKLFGMQHTESILVAFAFFILYCIGLLLLTLSLYMGMIFLTNSMFSLELIFSQDDFLFVEVDILV